METTNGSKSPYSGDPDAAREQLRLLGYKDGDPVYYRMINRGTGKARNNDRQFPDIPPQPKGFNSYIVVNGGGHRDEDVTEGKAIFYEHDKLPREEQIRLWQSLNLPEPTFQLDTGGKSVHSYWVLEAPIPITQWRELQSDLLEFADADRAIKNPSRVMRLAGSLYYPKDGDPLGVAQIVGRSGKRHSFETLRAAIPSQQKATVQPPTSPPRNGNGGGDPIPLERLMSREHRDLLSSGVGEGSRNSTLFRIAADAIGCENWARSNGIPFDGTAQGIAHDFAARCSPPLEGFEVEQTIRSAERSKPSPCLSDDKLQTCWDSWQRKNSPHPHTGKPKRWRDPKPITLDRDPDLAGDPIPPEDSPAGFYYRCRREIVGSDHWICWNGSLYRWGGTHYEAVSPESVKSLVWQFAAQYEVRRRGRDGLEYKAYPFSTPAYVKNAVEWIQLSCTVATVNPPGINCTNGFLELAWEGDTLIPTLRPHSPDRLVLSPPSCKYNPQADPTEYERLMQCLDPASRQIWERTIAASLDLPHVRKYQGRGVKALLLKGSGANGKDTLRAITQQLLGSEAIANTSTTDWQAYDNGTYFKVSGIRGKRISWASETSDIGRIEQLQGLKAAITGDPITIERKYQDGVKEPLAAVFLFSLNEMPNISTTLKAIESRWGIIPFNKTYSGNPREGELLADPRFKEDPNFIREKILPAFLNTLLRQLQAVVRHGIDYSATQGLLDEISREANHLQQFAQDVGLTPDPNSRIPVQQLWERLEQWYQDNGYLTYEMGSRGAKKAIWQDPGSKTDRLVKAAHQVVQRLRQVFPEAKRQTYRESGTGKTITYLAGLKLPEVFSKKEGSQGSQTSEPLQDKASGCEPYEKQGSQQGSQRVHNSEPVLPLPQAVNPTPQFVNPPNGFVNPTLKEGSHLQPLQDKASVPCEPYFEEKTSHGFNGHHPQPITDWDPDDFEEVEL